MMRAQPHASLLIVGLLAFALALGGLGPVALAQPAGLLPLGDAYIASGRPAENFSAKPTLWIGHNATSYGEEQALLAFAADGLPPRGTVIRTATLYLCLGGVTGEAALPIYAHRILAPFDPTTVTWQTRPLYDAQPAGSVAVAAALGWYAWDVRAALQAWADERDTPTFGLLLRSDAGDGHERTFWSRDYTAVAGQQPYLAVEYDAPTLTPTFTPSPTPSATPTITPSPSPTPTGPWARYREPAAPILVPLSAPRAVALEYFNAGPSTELSAAVVGGAVFENGESMLSRTVPAAGAGVMVIALQAKAGAQPGDSFFLSVQFGAFTVEPDPRPGVIARAVYLPLIVNSALIQPATSTPTNTATFTATFTPSPTWTPTPTRETITPSPTWTPTRETITPSPTPSATNTPTITPTYTPTKTWTPTFTPTKTWTPTNTPTKTRTPTFTPTKTWTPTPTPTITPSMTPSETPSTITAPSNLTAVALDGTSIKLTWADRSFNETGFWIFDITLGAYVANVPANTTYYTFTGLAQNAQHCYKMYAYNDYLTSEWTASACATTCWVTNGVVLFADKNYKGNCLVVVSNYDDLSRQGFNDMASSVKFLGWYVGRLTQVYENPYYMGTSSTFYGDDPDLSNDMIGDNRASSITIFY